MSIKNYIKFYGRLGNVLSAIAGGIIGFILGGPSIALAGIVIGGAFGYLLKKLVLKPIS